MAYISSFQPGPIAQTALGFVFVSSIALISRLWFLNPTFVEVDAGNFYNALVFGYDIEELFPHPPGFPIYIFVADIVNSFLRDPLFSLTIISAVSGAFTVGVLFVLVTMISNMRVALIVSFFLIVNPMAWAIGSAPLSDTLSMFLATLIALFSWRARENGDALVVAAILLSLAIGVRPNNVAFATLLLLPIASNLFGSPAKKASVTFLAGVGAVFMLVTASWLVAMIRIGTDGLGSYLRSLEKQTADVVASTTMFSLSPIEVIQRIVRFADGYVFVLPFSGSPDVGWPETLLVFPWIIGLTLFFLSFSFRRNLDVLLLLWLSGLFVSIALLHFLPRYGLPYIPPTIAASIIGLRVLGPMVRHRRALGPPVGIAILGSALWFVGLTLQTPVETFEGAPPELNIRFLLFPTGAIAIVTAAFVWRRMLRTVNMTSPDFPNFRIRFGSPWQRGAAVALVLAILGPATAAGIEVAKSASESPSPAQQLVAYVWRNYDQADITIAWDHQTHSIYEAYFPMLRPVGYESLDEFAEPYQQGKLILATTNYRIMGDWFDQLQSTLAPKEVASFNGDHFMWSKFPEARLLIAVKEQRSP